MTIALKAIFIQCWPNGSIFIAQLHLRGKVSSVGNNGEDDNFSSNRCSDSRYATDGKKVKIVNAVRTGRNANDIWLRLDESHIVHMNHGTLHRRLRRDSKVIGIRLAPSLKMYNSVSYAATKSC